MNNGLLIESNWLGREVGEELDKAFYADIGIAVDEDFVTRLEDRLANTVRNHLRGNSYQLASWFANNWWRLRWEPEIAAWSDNVNWRMAHSLAGIGGGFVWPNVIFASDGESIAIASRTYDLPNAIEPIRFLRQTTKRVSSASFEQSVDLFIEGVLSRLQTLNRSDENLASLWHEVLAERCDPVSTEYRKLEAICGYDPDESPEGEVEALLGSKDDFGASAIEEIAAAGRHETIKNVARISNLPKPLADNCDCGFKGRLPRITQVVQQNDSERPWQRAKRFAKIARQHWGLGDGPIDDKTLADLVQAKPDIFESQSIAVPMSLALRSDPDDESCAIYLQSRRKDNNRFALARLIGDNFCEFSRERLLPATKAKTARQQFQRAFGQEFLCPFDALKSMIGTEQADEEDINVAAEHFQVSPLLVKTTLVNKGELDREALSSP